MEVMFDGRSLFGDDFEFSRFGVSGQKKNSLMKEGKETSLLWV
jgi:hypothetical protein